MRQGTSMHRVPEVVGREGAAQRQFRAGAGAGRAWSGKGGKGRQLRFLRVRDGATVVDMPLLAVRWVWSGARQ